MPPSTKASPAPAVKSWAGSRTPTTFFPGALHTVGEIFARFPDVDWLSSLALSTWTRWPLHRRELAVEGFPAPPLLDGGCLPAARHYGWIPQESTFSRSL